MIDISIEKLDQTVAPPVLYLTVRSGNDTEKVPQPIDVATAKRIAAVLEEHPFRENKPGTYAHSIETVSEGGGKPYTLAIRIRKGKSRVRREIPSCPKPLFLMVWNVLTLQCLPSHFPKEARSR